MRSPSLRLRRLALPALLAWLAPLALAGTLYKWVDASGVTHYSDVPAEGAQSVDVAGAQSYHAPASRPASPAVGTVPPAGPVPVYQSLTITTPEPGAVLWNADGDIAVAVSLEPGLASGHHLWLELDGVRHEASDLSVQLPAPRGEHSLVAIVTDAAGLDVIASTPVAFSVRQNSAITPPRGPALPKKPHA
jgi:hypothetical protein